jgi:succinyl-diaminopimelate desuccinylase
MPDQGVNAVYAAARAVGRLEAFDFNVARHPVMGAPTLNVGTLHGGLNVNSVPDRAEIGIDIRTIPGMRHGPLRHQIASNLGSEVALASVVDVESAWTDTLSRRRPISPMPQRLTPALGGVPTVILGRAPPTWRTRPMNGVNARASRRLLRSMRA